MGLVKCPRCELNYMQESDKVCMVCRREMKGEEELEQLDLCSECGEHKVVPGEDLCVYCLKEIKRAEGAEAEEAAELEGSVLGLTEASAMDEIEIVDDADIPANEFKEMNGDEEEEDAAATVEG